MGVRVQSGTAAKKASVSAWQRWTASRLDSSMWMPYLPLLQACCMAGPGSAHAQPQTRVMASDCLQEACVFGLTKKTQQNTIKRRNKGTRTDRLRRSRPSNSCHGLGPFAGSQAAQSHSNTDTWQDADQPSHYQPSAVQQAQCSCSCRQYTIYSF